MLGFITSNVGRLVAYWSVENMTLDMTPYRMSLDITVSELPKEKKIKIIIPV